MRNLLLFLIAIFLLSVNSFSQTYTWATSDTAQNGTGASLARDLSGNLFAAETFTYSGVMNHASGVNLIKYNANHSIVWRQKFESWIQQADICTDALGNVYITSTFFTDTLLLNGIPQLFGGGMFVVKFDALGNLKWAQKSTSGDVRGISISTDANDNVYIGGNFQDSASLGGVSISSPSVNQNYIVKYNSNGTVQWVKHGSQDHFGTPDIATDALGNTYITGTFIRTVKFGSLSLTAYDPSGSQDDIYIAKIDASGNWIWAKHAGGIYQDDGSAITVDKKGNLFITGFIGSPTATFGNITLTNTGADDFFIAKYDTAGNVLWAVNGGGSGSQFGDDICVDKNGFVYLGTNSKFINKFDSIGNYVWWQQKPASNMAMVADNSGSVYIAGDFQGNISFDSFSLSASTNQMYIAKLYNPAPCIAPVAPTASNKIICSSNTAMLSANGSGTLGWYSQATGGTYLGGGVNYTTPTLTTTTTYYVQDSTCVASATRKAVLVTVNPLPTVTANANSSTVCAGTKVTLTGGGATSYTWSGGVANGVAFTPTTTTTYTVTGTDGNNCTNIATKKVTVNPLPSVTTHLNGVTITANQSGAVYQWLNCNTNHSPIAGATNQSYTVTTNGNYAVMVTMNGCLDTSTCINVTNIGIEKIVKDNNEFTVFPNPANNSFTINFSSTVKDELLVTIKNELGQTIYTENKKDFTGKYVNTIDLSNQVKGIYFVEVVLGSERRSKKIILE